MPEIIDCRHIHGMTDLFCKPMDDWFEVDGFVYSVYYYFSYFKGYFVQITLFYLHLLLLF